MAYLLNDASTISVSHLNGQISSACIDGCIHSEIYDSNSTNRKIEEETVDLWHNLYLTKKNTFLNYDNRFDFSRETVRDSWR